MKKKETPSRKLRSILEAEVKLFLTKITEHYIEFIPQLTRLIPRGELHFSSPGMQRFQRTLIQLSSNCHRYYFDRDESDYQLDMTCWIRRRSDKPTFRFHEARGRFVFPGGIIDWTRSRHRQEIGLIRNERGD